MGTTHADSLLSIAALEKDLKNAEMELTKASADRVLAQEVENQWHTEVTSLKNLIEVRRKRLSPRLTPSVLVSEQEQTPERDTDSDRRGLFSANGNEDSAGVNRVDWIYGAVETSGSSGMTPPEIIKLAAQEGVKMHQNYPYVVLGKLVKRDRVAKRRGRYYKKGS